MAEEKLPTRADDFAEWYNQLVIRAEMADYAPVRGCMVVRPYGWALWENIQQALDKRFKATGHMNAAFPLLIPKSFLEKEKEHVEGFSPELAIVTIGGGEILEEPLIVRPTSETVIGYMYAKWIKSYRDLPVLINQWGNVVRWELRTKLFLRTLEFYWQEGHTAHATAQEAQEETLRMLDVYADFAINEAAVPVIKGIKSPTEKFAGAIQSTTIEAMMGDTRALQSGTSHFLGQNFAKAFNIQYLDVNNTLQHCWTTSWGLSTRFIGAIIMTHGDDQGLVLPPRLAPIQVVIIPIYKNDVERSAVTEVVEKLKSELGAFRIKIDDRTEVTPGFKFNDWEMRGVPLRIEVGPKDVEKGTLALSRRDHPGRAGKSFVPQTGIASNVADTLDDIQKSLLARATVFRDANIHDPQNYEELKEVVTKGWAYSWWCESPECEARVKEDTKASTRCIPIDQTSGSGTCVVCGEKATKKVYYAKSY
ncbi:MAG: proline--tRNA ligase [Chloroflexi bacterium GWB2_49_20]|nr:MAG: proline--tRNA ligase [Chloroflexi bacterium GWB2_49_20]OGN79974.1 MAG: proline--tRNA ligase [Chloroflexi bacterium GWC2_49_37]OGN85490.1 MAG: proline--tRNA ligase [Chloroflexi bacterium GWD2_49_16]HBG74359.1 proline--tRNA ligase [Anaerolineae bacterium]HCM97031.1 proline--tRNA ligase [Anaerolineae bacterium]